MHAMYCSIRSIIIFIEEDKPPISLYSAITIAVYSIGPVQCVRQCNTYYSVQ